MACETFVMLNGGIIDAGDLELYPCHVALAEGTLPEADFADWLRKHIRFDAGKRVNEPRARYGR